MSSNPPASEYLGGFAIGLVFAALNYQLLINSNDNIYSLGIVIYLIIALITIIISATSTNWINNNAFITIILISCTIFGFFSLLIGVGRIDINIKKNKFIIS